MNKSIKIILTLLIAIMCVFSSVQVYAADDDKVTSFKIDALKPSDETTADTDIAKIGSNIISVVSSIGMVVAVVVLMVLGVKYMVGSTEEKSKYKDSVMPFIVGALLLFVASGIVKIVYNVADGFNTAYVIEEVVEEEKIELV